MAPYLLAEVYAATERETEIVFVYVPDLNDSKKPQGSVPWDQIVPRLSPTPQRTVVFEYKHAMSSKESLSWLLDRGSTLFIELFDYQLPRRQSLGSEPPSIYLIGEFMGGLMLKQAFASTIHRVYAWKSSLASIRGVFLLGVPQIELDGHRERLTSVLPTKAVRDSVLSAKVLEAVCVSSQQFKQVVTAHCPALTVISAYTSVQSKSGFKNLFSKASATTPETVVRIGLGGQETTLDLNSDVKSVWHPTSRSVFDECIRAQVDKTRRTQPQNLPAQSTPSTQQGSSGVPLIPPLGQQSPLQSSASETSGQPSGSSLVILTPPSSHRDHSPISVSPAIRNPLPACITTPLPFYYPESLLDRQAYFAGRTNELTEMLKQLKPIESDDKSTQLRSLCLSGMGGLGKTELAYQFAKSCQNTYDVIMIVKSDTTFRLKRTFSKLAAKVGLLSDTEKPSDDEYREALKAWLKRPYRMPAPTSTTTGQSKESESIIAKWLLIFDNVEHWADLKPYWPEKGCGSVLVTTRKPDLLSHFETPECVVSLELRPLPKQDAIKLLSHFAGSDPASSPHVEGAAQDLCVRLGGLPLAVMQVGAYIKQCKLTILEFCQAHPKESDLYTIYLDEHRVEDYEYSLASVWALQPSSTGGGSLEQPSRLLCIMSLLDPEGIREELLKPDAAVDEVSGYPTSEPEFIRHYRALINASLVEKTQKSKFTIHRLVQKVTRAQIARDETLSEQVFNQTLRRLTDRWPYVNRIYQIGTQGHVDRWKSCKKWSPHVYALSQAYTEFRERGRLNKPSLELAELLYELAVYFSETSQPKEASRILDISESICSSAKGMTDTSEHDLRIYRGRIGVAFILRDGEAYLHYAKKELAAETARSTKPSSALAGANLHIGIAYGFNFLWKEARKYFKISMKIREEMPGFKKDWLFSPYYQLAHAYYHLNKNEKAALCLENAISDRVEAFGQTDSYSMRTGALYYTLGDVKIRQGLAHEGFTLHVKAHAHLERTAGPTGRGTLHCKYKMAMHYVHLHSYTIARQYLDEILPHYRMADYLHPYICRTAFLYAKTLPATDPERTKLLEEATRVFNSYSKYEKRTTDTLTELDAQSLVAYDYL